MTTDQLRTKLSRLIEIHAHIDRLEAEIPHLLRQTRVDLGLADFGGSFFETAVPPAPNGEQQRLREVVAEIVTAAGKRLHHTEIFAQLVARAYPFKNPRTAERDFPLRLRGLPGIRWVGRGHFDLRRDLIRDAVFPRQNV